MHMPDSGLLPSYARVTSLSRMHERHDGGTYMGLQEYAVNVPITDPRRSRVGSWHYNVQGNATLTLMDAGGGLDLRRDELLMIALPITLIKPLEHGGKFMFTIMPRYAGDAAQPAYAWDMLLMADYHVKRSETLSYSIGLVCSPRFAEYVLLPYLSLRWQVTPKWLIRLTGEQLAALYAVTERLQIGPALSHRGGVWMVDRPADSPKIFRVRSLVASLLMEYDFTSPGQTKRIMTAEVGATLASTAQFCRRSAGRDALESHHYKPGLALSVSVDFRF